MDDAQRLQALTKRVKRFEWFASVFNRGFVPFVALNALFIEWRYVANVIPVLSATASVVHCAVLLAVFVLCLWCAKSITNTIEEIVGSCRQYLRLEQERAERHQFDATFKRLVEQHASQYGNQNRSAACA